MDLSDGSKVCIDCGAWFTVDDGERRYFTDRNFQLPKRCRPCRQLRKDLRHVEDVQRAEDVLGL